MVAENATTLGVRSQGSQAFLPSRTGVHRIASLMPPVFAARTVQTVIPAQHPDAQGCFLPISRLPKQLPADGQECIARRHSQGRNASVGF